jgi:uncharacterized protein (TIGR03435 family)
MRVLVPALFLSSVFGQTLPSFDVAAIKPADPNSPSLPGLLLLPGSLTAMSLTVRQLVNAAYPLNVPPGASGGPKWIDSDKFSISAKASDPLATEAQVRLMLRSLLAERFQLVVHTEVKQQTLHYLLVDGKLKMTPGAPEARAQVDNKRLPDGSYRVSFKNLPVSRLIAIIRGQMQATVEDHTGLSGVFDIEFEVPPDGQPVRELPMLAPSVRQVGLKLEEHKVDRDILVVDSAAKPSEN